MERWNGKLGIGNLNAATAIERAIALAREYGIGVVGAEKHQPLDAPRQLRADGRGSWLHRYIVDEYSTQHASLGRGRTRGLVTIPSCSPYPTAMSRCFWISRCRCLAYGKLETYARQGKELPLDGGFDKTQNPTHNAAEIIETQQILPVWLLEGFGACADA